MIPKRDNNIPIIGRRYFFGFLLISYIEEINKSGEINSTSMKLKEGRKVVEKILVEENSKTRENISNPNRILNIFDMLID